MQTLPIVNFTDVIKIIYATARLADLKDTVKRYPGIKEVQEAYENADAALFDPPFCGTVQSGALEFESQTKTTQKEKRYGDKRLRLSISSMLAPATVITALLLLSPAASLRAQFAYVANADAGTVSAYSIDSNVTLTPVPGMPFSAGV